MEIKMAQYVTPWSGDLEEGVYRISAPEQVKSGDKVYSFKQWEDGSTGVVREVNLTSDMTLLATYELTMGLVASVSDPYVTQGSFQRKCFYANGRFWVFYANNNSIVYRTSIDGISWTDETVIRVAGTYGPLVSVFFDGKYVHYASCSTGTYPYDSKIYYRRGLPNSDGTITWSAPEQVVNTAYNRASNPHIGVDSNGYIWIGYRELVNGKRCPFVIKSGNNDGTWGTTPSGFPYQLSTVQKGTWAVSPIPLTNGKVAIIFTGHDYGGPYGEPIHIRLWNGSSWLPEVTTVGGCYHSMFHSAVGEGDTVHIVYQRIGVDSTDIAYVKYVPNSLSPEVTLHSGIPLTDDGTDYCAPIIARAGDKLYVFWGFHPEYGHIYYRKWNGPEWEPIIDWIDESAEGFPRDQTWSCFYTSSPEGYLGFMYLTGTAAPYHVKFSYFMAEPTLPVPPSVPPTAPPTRPAIVGPLGLWRFPILSWLLQLLQRIRGKSS